MRAVKFLRYAPVAICVLFSSGFGCDTLNRGTYGGYCEEPDGGLYPGPGTGMYNNGMQPPDPEQLRKVNCQAQGPPHGPDICCHRNRGDARSVCLTPAECYIGNKGDVCAGDIDCNVALRCSSGACVCAEDPTFVQFIDHVQNTSFCCPPGSTNNMGACMPPTPPDMTVTPPDLSVPDLHR